VLRSQMPGYRPGDPAAVAAEHSAAAEEAVREGAKIARTQEKRLWNRPSLVRPNVSTHTTKSAVRDLAHSVAQGHEPDLNIDAVNHSRIQSVIRTAERLPDKAAANQINDVAHEFGKIARDHTLPGDVRAAAGRMRDAARGGLMDAPEISGRPPVTTTPGWGVNPTTGHTEWLKGGTTPAISPDPVLVRDFREANRFTRRKHDVFDHAGFDKIWARNSSGNLTLNEGEGLGRFFNFGTGRLRQGEIKEAAKMLDDIGSSWHALGDPRFNPADAAQVRQELVDNTRGYLTATLLQHVLHSSAFDETGERAVDMAKLRVSLNRNRQMLIDSGAYTPPQLAMWNRIFDMTNRIQEAQRRGGTISSKTYEGLTSDHKFLDALFGSQIGRWVMTTGAAAGGEWAGHAIGGMLGVPGVGSLVGTGVGVLIEKAVEGLARMPRQEALRLLDQALNGDPQLANDLMKTAAKGAQISDKFRQYLQHIIAVSAGHIGADYAYSATPVRH
jgi:hypothetical protein